MSGTSVPYEPGAHPIGAPIKTPNEGHTILSDDEIRRALTRIAFEILESNKGTDNLVLLGIRSRGYPLAQRLAQRIQTNDSNLISKWPGRCSILPRIAMTSPMRNMKTAARGSP